MSERDRQQRPPGLRPLITAPRSGMAGPHHSELTQLAAMLDAAPAVTRLQAQARALQRKPNRSGLPDQLKSGIEALSGVSMDDVRVHRNSARPAQLQAHAYAQGRDIHLGPGQEHHLPHEAWHVVQQAQGRVRPTMQMKEGMAVNDDQGLEHEADVMGATALAPVAQRRERPEEDELLQGKLASVQRTARQDRGAEAAGPSARAGSGAGVVQRKLKIKGPDGNTYNTLKKFQQSPIYERTVPPLASKYGLEKVEYYLSQLISAENEFENEQHFIEALTYDIEHKSMKDEPLTLQEQYMTLYGWKRRDEQTPSARSSVPSTSKMSSSFPGKKGQSSLGSAQDTQPAKALKVYRTMKVVDWNALKKGDFSVLAGGHLGDFKQAHDYLFRKSPEPKVLIEFTLKAGAERTLFSSSVMAFPPSKGKAVPNMIKGALIKEGSDDSFGRATPNEGLATDKVGIKSEGGEAGFSLGISGGKTPELFMNLVAGMRVIGQSGEQSGSVEEEGGGKPEFDIVNGRRYDVNDPRIRQGGACLWDTLQVEYAYTAQELQNAAANIGLNYEQHVDDNQVWPLLQELGATGMTLDVWPYGREYDAHTITEGDGSIVIGLAHAEDGLGHYVPPQ